MLLKIGVPWQQALDLNEAEAAGYLDAYAELNGVKKEAKRIRPTRRAPKK